MSFQSVDHTEIFVHFNTAASGMTGSTSDRSTPVMPPVRLFENACKQSSITQELVWNTLDIQCLSANPTCFVSALII